MSAALKMIELLDKAGELDDRLIPIPKEAWVKKHLDFDMNLEDELHKANGFKFKIGTSKTRRDYEFKVFMTQNLVDLADSSLNLSLTSIDQQRVEKQSHTRGSAAVSVSDRYRPETRELIRPRHPKLHLQTCQHWLSEWEKA